MIFNDHSILLYRDYWVILDCNIMITYLDISQLRNFLKTFSTSMINGIQGSFNTKVLGLLLNHGLWLWYQTSSFLSFYLTLGSYGHGSYGHGSYGHGSYGHGSYGRGPYGGELPLSMSLVQRGTPGQIFQKCVFWLPISNEGSHRCWEIFVSKIFAFKVFDFIS